MPARFILAVLRAFIDVPLPSERNNTALVTAISVTANDSVTILFQITIQWRWCIIAQKLLSCVVIKTALDGMKKNQLS